MTTVGLWTIGLALAYTAWLILGSRIAVGRSGRGGFFVSGRSFSPWTVAFCITGLFSGSSYIAIVELSYRTGVSAVWYGVAETVQILLIALLLVKPLREKLVVTVTGIIGDRFGRGAQAISSVITGLTFPMYSVATSIAFASALFAVTEIPLWQCIALTAIILLAFLTFGGMRSVAFSQTMNVLMIFVMFIVGIWAFLVSPGPSGLETLAEEQPQMFDVSNAGISLIVAWFGTFIVNVPLAQAAFQMSMSARSPEDGQKGLFLAAIIGMPLILLGIVVGVAASIVVPDASLPLVGIAEYIAGSLPAWAAAVFFVGLWACALGWAGPCQFSGATSLGRDLGSALRPRATQVELVRYTRIALVGLTVLMVIFSLLRAEESAWWNVMAWTLRNGATFAPVLAAFFWPLATRSAALTALLAGFSAGLGWYALSGFSATDFFLGTHPVWVAMIANLAGIVLVTLIQGSWRLTLHAARRRNGGLVLLVTGLAAVLSMNISAWLNSYGLMGLALFLITLGVFAAAVLLAESPTATHTKTQLWGSRTEPVTAQNTSPL
ncbi:sodium:solute symporter family protein [Nesterenkonia sp. LB17]|uniref:sodium:solute symporter family protein n=1 Tax=unclassified Nesterenkonia TaxID=2629769 RepID=UPI001F4CD649|nr:sodium:solute symporter family protein [Nesterenkonia sp. DZ6]MCH8562586.1 sodium:solute symporter family protein [Nesterenkonia sp. YGD6]MCH8565510.1 sodium:solute symporter family protein [Nesterenkonia sp. LB17]